jgi:hypothetical protein
MAYPYPFWGGPFGYGYGNYSSNNIIGSAIANQSMNNIGIGNTGTQFAAPIVI